MCRSSTAAGEQIVVGVAPEAVGSDRGLMRPMVETAQALRPLCRPAISSTADSGSATTSNGRMAKASRSIVHRPNPSTAAIRSCRGPAMDQASSPGAPHGKRSGKAQYKDRAICECIHARWRNWDLRQLTVRGTKRSARSCSGTLSPTTSCKPTASAPHKPEFIDKFEPQTADLPPPAVAILLKDPARTERVTSSQDDGSELRRIEGRNASARFVDALAKALDQSQHA